MSICFQLLDELLLHDNAPTHISWFNRSIAILRFRLTFPSSTTTVLRPLSLLLLLLLLLLLVFQSATQEVLYSFLSTHSSSVNHLIPGIYPIRHDYSGNNSGVEGTGGGGVGEKGHPHPFLISIVCGWASDAEPLKCTDCPYAPESIVYETFARQWDRKAAFPTSAHRLWGLMLDYVVAIRSELLGRRTVIRTTGERLQRIRFC